MIIKIKENRTKQIANSIACYIFKELKENPNAHNLIWADNLCKFYKTLNDLSETESENIIEIDIAELIREDLANLIEKYLLLEAGEYVDDDIEWLSEMIDIYKQLNGENLVEKNDETNNKNEKKDNNSVADIGYEKINNTQKNEEELENDENDFEFLPLGDEEEELF